jgi:hypothetical protein
MWAINCGCDACLDRVLEVACEQGHLRGLSTAYKVAAEDLRTAMMPSKTSLSAEKVDAIAGTFEIKAEQYAKEPRDDE